jgi:Polyketide cyclase / dehydrase and lipid transport
VQLTVVQPSAFAARTTDVPREVLWRVVSDPTLLPPLSDELQAVRVRTEGPVALGTVFEGDQLVGDRRWTSTSTVTTFDEPTAFAWTVGPLDQPVARWAFFLDAHDAGVTVTHTAVLLGGPSPLSRFVAADPLRAPQIVQDRLDLFRDRLGQTVEGLIALAGGVVLA